MSDAISDEAVAAPLIGCGTGLIPGDRCPCYLAGQIDASEDDP